MNGLNPPKDSKNSTENVIKRSKELYGYTPEEKSDENMEWMLQNGYIQKKRNKRGTRGRRTKPRAREASPSPAAPPPLTPPAEEP